MSKKRTPRTGYIYLASPYSHPNKVIREMRYRMVRKVAAVLCLQGYTIFSPIVHSHELSQDFPEHDTKHTKWDFWKRDDTVFVDRSSALFVLKIDGWKESKGVQAEIRLARKLKKPITYLNAQFKGEVMMGLRANECG